MRIVVRNAVELGVLLYETVVVIIYPHVPFRVAGVVVVHELHVSFDTVPLVHLHVDRGAKISAGWPLDIE